MIIPRKRECISEESLINIKQDPINQDWFSICFFNILDENFIREYQEYMEWFPISLNQILSEEFIIEFQDKVDWYYISWHQRLSIKFITEFSHRINYNLLMLNKNIDNDVKDFCRMFV